MTEVVLGLGSNLGDRRANLEAALRLLTEAGVAIRSVSSAWLTPPMPAGQPDFLNAVVVGETARNPHELLELVKVIERELGRRPNRRWGPRPIDVDILFYGQEQVGDEELVVPHPGIAERGFVLAPLAEVVRGPLPVLGASAVEYLAQVDRTGLARSGALTIPGAPTA
jgi:2-amino-4-hydroxy-6-hydroxymethyldihydropteridine diphosphokinase